ncbi:CAAX prenyl protease 2-like isoform X2 [Gordionus sp. m RMFG-2023]|uniref:CAAX prenyl protease 2-like isoform X2 n=1 Tax=Gordionus sp. m RMFG-2023 TaxID=3053472 RepID=UPI0031FDA662
MAISVYSFANAKHNHNYRDIGQSYPIITCLFLSTLYVLGLYLWPNKYLRDDPVVIKYRFFSVLLTCLISPIFICWHISNKSDILIHLGIRKSGLIAAIFIPLFTLFLLFLGPIYLWFLENKEKEYHKYYSKISIYGLRNYIIAPLTEEYIFRSCIVSILLTYHTHSKTIFIASFIFGLAHFHHIFENINKGISLNRALIISCFQFIYTTIFGAYSTFVFIITDVDYKTL